MTKENTARVIRETPEHVRVLYEMLTYKRRDNSKTEEEFIETFIRPLGVEEDEYGNLYKVVGETPIILWSSHTDTVHAEGGRQQLELTEDGWLGVPEDGKSNCLGADCGAGVWIMVNMIERGVPGLYIFHRAEESGGRGSTYFAEHMLGKVAPDGIKAAIAFDRRGFTSIITHQWGGRCCSEAFAASLARELDPSEACLWRPDDGGTFTDTANYTHMIPECTNLSVGYLQEHSKNECLFVPHLEGLLEQVCGINQEALVIERDPSDEDEKIVTFAPAIKGTYRGGHYVPNPTEREIADMVDAILDHPEIAAALLLSEGVSTDDILWEAYKTAPEEKDDSPWPHETSDAPEDADWRERLADQLREEQV